MPESPLGLENNINEWLTHTVWATSIVCRAGRPFLFGFAFHELIFPTLAGSLHVGDEILEINGKSVTNHSVDQLQKMLVGTWGNWMKDQRFLLFTASS